MNSNKNVTANFDLNPYDLTITYGDFGGTYPSGVRPSKHGVAFTVIATPITGAYFTGWSASPNVSISNPASTNIDVSLAGGNGTLHANFAMIPYILKIESVCSGTSPAIGPHNAIYGNIVSLIAPASCTLVPPPGPSIKFKSWTVESGDANLNVNGRIGTAIIGGNATLRANYSY
jgi:hypothetical protein